MILQTLLGHCSLIFLYEVMFHFFLRELRGVFIHVRNLLPFVVFLWKKRYFLKFRFTSPDRFNKQMAAVILQLIIRFVQIIPKTDIFFPQTLLKITVGSKTTTLPATTIRHAFYQLQRSFTSIWDVAQPLQTLIFFSFTYQHLDAVSRYSEPWFSDKNCFQECKTFDIKQWAVCFIQ